MLQHPDGFEPRILTGLSSQQSTRKMVLSSRSCPPPLQCQFLPGLHQDKLRTFLLVRTIPRPFKIEFLRADGLYHRYHDYSL